MGKHGSQFFAHRCAVWTWQDAAALVRALRSFTPVEEALLLLPKEAGLGSAFTADHRRGSKPMGSHFWVGEFTTHSRTDFSGDWDVQGGGTIWILTHGHINRRSR